MMLTMPKSMGGLAIRAIKTDYPIPVPKRYAALTRRTVFYLDALLESRSSWGLFRDRRPEYYGAITHRAQDSLTR